MEVIVNPQISRRQLILGAAASVVLYGCGELSEQQADAAAAPQMEQVNGAADAYAVAVRGTVPGTEVPAPPSCDKAAWVEGYINRANSDLSYKFAVYDVTTGQVNRYDAPDITGLTGIASTEVDPSACAAPGVVYQYYSGNKVVLERRNLQTGARESIYHPYMDVTTVAQPDPLDYPATARPVYFQSFAGGQRNVESTNNDSVGGTAVIDFAISDSGMTYADVQEYTKIFDGSNFEQAQMIHMNTYSDPARTQGVLRSSVEFRVNDGTSFKKIEVSSDGSRVFALRSISNQPAQLVEVVKSNTSQQGIDFKPFSFAGSNSLIVSDFRLAGPNTAVAIVQDNASSPQKTIRIDLSTGATTGLSAEDVAFVQF